MKNKKQEFIDVVEFNTVILINKYNLSNYIHENKYFEYGLNVGMCSLEQYLKEHYTFKKKPKIRRKKWKPKRRRRKKFYVKEIKN